MKYKTKYKLNDIVIFEMDGNKKVGEIYDIKILDSIHYMTPSFSYYVRELKPLSNSILDCSKNWICECDILKKLNKKAFLATLSSECAKEIYEKYWGQLCDK